MADKPKRTLAQIDPTLKRSGPSGRAPGPSVGLGKIVGGAPLRTLATVVPQRGTTSAHRDCQHCEGFRRDGMWFHSDRCPYTVVLWCVGERRLGSTGTVEGEAWTRTAFQCCPFRCAGQRLASGVTHSWNCPWWDDPTYNPGQTTPLHLVEPAALT